MTKYTRLVRAEGLSEDLTALRLVFQDWPSQKEANTIDVPLDSLPLPVAIQVGQGLFPIQLICKMNLDAENKDQLDLSDFEIAPRSASEAHV